MNRILKLHHPTGHPYWDRDEYKIEMPDGEMINPQNFIEDNYGGFRVFWNDAGVWVQICASGTGYGKVDRTGHPPRLLVPRDQYDKIEFVGEPLVMNENLKRELSESGLPY